MRQTRFLLAKAPASAVKLACCLACCLACWAAVAIASIGCADPSSPAEASEARALSLAAPSSATPPASAAKPASSQEDGKTGRPEGMGPGSPGLGGPTASASAAPGARAATPPPVVPPPDQPGDRIYAKARHVWIQPAPRSSKGWLGYLTLGGSVRLWEGSAEKAKVLGSGCDAWYRVEPAGYVCAGEDATLDPNDPAFVALKKGAGNPASPWPFRYAESIGTRRYVELPDATEQRKREWDLDEHRARIERAKTAASPADVPKQLVGVDLTPAGKAAPELFPFGGKVREARDSVAPTSTIAFIDEFDHAGRTWLLTSDRALVPKDRTKPYPESSFEGVLLSDTVTLPIAFFRKKDRPSFRRGGEGIFEEQGSFARKSWVGLTGNRETVGRDTYAETRDAGRWVRVEDAAIAEQAEAPPMRDLADGPGRNTWLDVSVLGGTLVAYEGMKPVFTTLIAPGRGGLPVPGRDPISTASTPIGTFRVDGKFAWATMVSSTDSSVVHAEVMYVQNFHGAHALHGAYWHDGWGELKSGGCVNLSPIDSKWVFEWTEPRLPPGWQGLRSVPEMGRPTVVRVRR